MDADVQASSSAPTTELKRPNTDEPVEMEPMEKKQKLEIEPEVSEQPGALEPAAESATADAAPQDKDKAKKGKQRQTRREVREKREKEKEQRVRRGSRRDGEPAPDDGTPKEPRLPKRQTALLLGFCGSGYSGMQMYVPVSMLYLKDANICMRLLGCCFARQWHQKDVRTIEGVLFDALVKVGAVSKDNSDNATKVWSARSSGPCSHKLILACRSTSTALREQTQACMLQETWCL